MQDERPVAEIIESALEYTLLYGTDAARKIILDEVECSVEEFVCRTVWADFLEPAVPFEPIVTPPLEIA